MASWVLSQCGTNPLPSIIPQPRTGPISKNPSKFGFFRADPNLTPPGLFSRGRKWVPKVSGPLKVPSLNEENRERIVGLTGFDDGPEFDPGLPPPFKLVAIQAAIPAHCWVKDPWKSMSYVARDVTIVIGSDFFGKRDFDF